MIHTQKPQITRQHKNSHSNDIKSLQECNESESKYLKNIKNMMS